jgi:N6-L-threonylcarbamoyladenine synthase
VKKTNIYILAIESSCDDTSCALLCNAKVLSNITAGQKIHERYGGVVPELASRDHQKNIVPVVDAVLAESGVLLSEIDAVAVTRGPGLMGSLLVGLSFAKSLALALNRPLIDVNHMQGHVLAHFIDSDYQKKPQFPFLCLTVSGGHTQLVLVKDYLDFEIVGETIDDAIGEAFDKAAKILGLAYPGGPLIDQFAKKGNPSSFRFAATKADGYNYSFSGIKTSFLYFIQKAVEKDKDFIEKNIHDVCASYQNHLVSVVLKHAWKALGDLQIKHFAIAGGVSANSELRRRVNEMEGELGIQTYIPEFQYCTDNAAMIGMAAHYKYLKSDFSKMDLSPSARMPL